MDHFQSYPRSFKNPSKTAKFKRERVVRVIVDYSSRGSIARSILFHYRVTQPPSFEYKINIQSWPFREASHFVTFVRHTK